MRGFECGAEGPWPANRSPDPGLLGVKAFLKCALVCSDCSAEMIGNHELVSCAM